MTRDEGAIRVEEPLSREYSHIKPLWILVSSLLSRVRYIVPFLTKMPVKRYARVRVPAGSFRQNNGVPVENGG